MPAEELIILSEPYQDWKGGGQKWTFSDLSRWWIYINFKELRDPYRIQCSNFVSQIWRLTLAFRAFRRFKIQGEKIISNTRDSTFFKEFQPSFFQIFQNAVVPTLVFWFQPLHCQMAEPLTNLLSSASWHKILQVSNQI